MEDEPQLGSPSADVRWLTFAELADEMCPVYMSMGVPYAEYWRGDYTQLAFYRKAYEMRREQANYDAYLQGSYFYDALCMVSPVLHAFAKNGTKPIPYHEKPYGMKTGGEKQEHATEAKVGAAKFLSFAAKFNQKFTKNKGVEDNGSNNRPTPN